jgi:hypothetical protein
VSAIDLEEMSLPTFRLDVEGRARFELGKHTAELALDEDKATLTFFEGKRRLKSAPAGDEVAELKATHEELALSFVIVSARFESPARTTSRNLVFESTGDARTKIGHCVRAACANLEREAVCAAC